MRHFSRFVSAIFIVTMLLAQSGWASMRWEKGLKLKAYSNLNSASDFHNWRGEVNGNFVLSSPFFSLLNQVQMRYDETSHANPTNNPTTINDEGWLIAETYRRQISPFVFWGIYQALNGSIVDYSNKNLGSQTSPFIGKQFNRYLQGSTGLDFNIPNVNADTLDNSLWAKVGLVYNKPLNYRTQLTAAPYIKVLLPTKSGQSNAMAAGFSVFSINYKLSQKLSFDASVSVEYTYDFDETVSKKDGIYRTHNINLTYDVFQY